MGLRRFVHTSGPLHIRRWPGIQEQRHFKSFPLVPILDDVGVSRQMAVVERGDAEGIGVWILPNDKKFNPIIPVFPSKSPDVLRRIKRRAELREPEFAQPVVFLFRFGVAFFPGCFGESTNLTAIESRSSLLASSCMMESSSCPKRLEEVYCIC